MLGDIMNASVTNFYDSRGRQLPVHEWPRALSQSPSNR